MVCAEDLRTFEQIAEECPAFPVNRLRYLYENRQTNGTAAANVLVKLGRLRMVNKTQLNAWVAQKQENE
jgi:hypothetical protein